jgi:diadenosine tetraphosphate (Ap4A) HIT family hydrolase
MSDCYSCDSSAALDSQPDRERVVVRDGWRVAHAFDASLPGWLVVLPMRHVLALDELTDDEAAALGPLLRDVSAALSAETGCVKTYTMLFAEADGFAHLHVHVVPRMPWFTHDQVGPRVFTFLGATESDRVPYADQDALARRLRARLI